MDTTNAQGLYPDQVLVAEQFEAWLNGKPELSAGLWASAGFGKSYSAKFLIDEVIIKQSNYSPVITSMTHSAVEVLEGFIGRPVTTLHALMGWVPQINKETGEEYVSTPKMRDKSAKPKLHNGMVVIVDEAGLMGHEECRLLEQEASEANARILYIGDHKQCFPVIKEGEEMCIPAYRSTGTYLKLTIPKRVNTGDAIYALSMAYRKTVDGFRQPKLRTVLSPGSRKGVTVSDDIEENAIEAFKSAIQNGTSKQVKVLAFTNKRCLNLNRKIRKKVLGLSTSTPLVGEEMVANAGVSNMLGDNVLLKNNQKVVVKEVEPTETHGLKGAYVLFIDELGQTLPERVFVPESPQKLTDRLKMIANIAKEYSLTATATKDQGEAEQFRLAAKQEWRSFFALKEACADIRFTYAMTVNKSQGTTLKHVLVDLYDINGCRDKEQAARLAYTAVTRATDNVTIEGELDG
tara:strand:- start:331 stop:1716 length:1386 start_codon:yes stop_codon:yes gene_type:complete